MQPSFQAGKQAAAYRDPAGRRPVYAANPRKQQQGTFPARLGSPPASSINSGGSAGGSSSSGSQGDQLSKTNLYIKGLTHTTTDKDLLNLCAPYGNIISTKAILDKDTNKCKGYGFVDFESPLAAEKAVKALQAQGVQAQMAKQQEQDPTNLYMANLPLYMAEQDLEQLLQAHGAVISTRILRDNSAQSRGVGFARMESKEKCEQIIATFNGKVLAGSKEPLLVKFADGGNKKRTLYKNHEHRMWRDGEGLPYEQGALSQNGVGQPLVPAALGGYQPAQQRGYSAAATPTAYALHGGAWMQPAQYIMQAPHLATTPQMLQSSLEPLAHAYSPMLPQLTAQMNQLSIPGASYMAAAGAHPYGSPAPTLYQQAPQLVQQIPLSEDPSNGGLGNGEDAAPYQGYP
ncbi:RNA-binding motif, single-stranded-interacting protein 1 isoform X2 [Rhipicephalus sanguineus]|uniref:RNA-binding motif, single-stranded-interacting protein 1 isoform X2 n=1 Tax=Rhipicephalus sanguineus TaxID=34632 RepID=UPI0020C21969|nr:RNA-binding motif, single-stranded-interacting protein 1 isoform X2 [Rhipicephalus sanguineus]XP_049269126.1 RNA-binding motif, single-stranded-interacting protein 1 isoform X2 [Rhipicephalus sanguineus]